MNDFASSDMRPPFLCEEDPPPFELVNETGSAPVLLVCDHASKAVPRCLDGLGLDDAALSQHIGWDIGAAEVTRRLAAHLDAAAVLAGYSRLVIDLNRQPGDPTSIPEISDNVAVPGNFGLDEYEAELRLAHLFRPYHNAVTATLARLWHHGERAAPAVIAVHSFTPVMNCCPRPWHAGILWNRDPRMAVPLLKSLARRRDLCIGDNEPYSGRLIAYTIDRHASAAGLPHVSIEIRQDLIADDAGAELWAGILAEALTPILAQPGLHRVEHY